MIRECSSCALLLGYLAHFSKTVMDGGVSLSRTRSCLRSLSVYVPPPVRSIFILRVTHPCLSPAPHHCKRKLGTKVKKFGERNNFSTPPSGESLLRYTGYVQDEGTPVRKQKKKKVRYTGYV